MNGIGLRNGCVFFYGNPAGYVIKEQAVMDNMFRCSELESWLARQNLAAKWTDGVYERIMAGGGAVSPENAAPVKSCRIWQLCPDVDVRMKFISYGEMVREFGEPELSQYRTVYDGQLETDRLSAIYEKFNTTRPPGYTGHSLSMSDIIELYDEAESRFFYVDRLGFQEVSFDPPEQSQGMSMSL